MVLNGLRRQRASNPATDLGSAKDDGLACLGEDRAIALGRQRPVASRRPTQTLTLPTRLGRQSSRRPRRAAPCSMSELGHEQRRPAPAAAVPATPRPRLVVLTALATTAATANAVLVVTSRIHSRWLATTAPGTLARTATAPAPVGPRSRRAPACWRSWRSRARWASPAAAGGFLVRPPLVVPLVALVALRRAAGSLGGVRTPLAGLVVPLALAASAVVDRRGRAPAGAAGGLGWLALGALGALARRFSAAAATSEA